MPFLPRQAPVIGSCLQSRCLCPCRKQNCPPACLVLLSKPRPLGGQPVTGSAGSCLVHLIRHTGRVGQGRCWICFRSPQEGVGCVPGRRCVDPWGTGASPFLGASVAPRGSPQAIWGLKPRISRVPQTWVESISCGEGAASQSEPQHMQGSHSLCCSSESAPP